MARIAFTYDGDALTLDLDSVTTRQAITIEGYVGRSVTAWTQALKDGGAKDLTACAWLAYTQTGLPIDDLDDLDIPFVKFFEALSVAALAKAGDEVDADPPQATVAADEESAVAHVTSTPHLSAVNI